MAVNVDAGTLHRIEFQAGQSNTVILSKGEVALTKLLIQKLEAKIVTGVELLSVKSRLERLKIAIAPHKTVPQEVVGEIFRQSASDLVNTYPADIRSTPWVMRQICSMWRANALAKPSFWNHIAFNSTLKKTDSSRIDVWIKHIAHPSHPLSLEMNCYNLRSNIIFHSAVLLPYHARICRLTAGAWSQLFALPIGSFPLLKSLKIVIHDDAFYSGWDSPSYEESPCFIGMDSLRELDITFAVSSNHHMYLPNTLPCNQLASLKLQCDDSILTIYAALHILQRCPQLEECVLLVPGTEEETMNPMTVHLPYLSSLTVILRWDGPIDKGITLLDFLIVPALVTLELQLSSENQHKAMINSVASLVYRSGCSLRSLVLPNMHEPRHAIPRTAFEAISSLSVLGTAAIIFSDEIIEEIAQGHLLPNVVSLVLSGGGKDAVHSLVKLVETRFRLYQAPDAVPDLRPPLIRDIHIKLVSEKLCGDFMARVEDYLTRVKLCGADMTVSN
ncbi:hypothetical protein C0991_009325 [Blastosporella zonata]|nr:hypothetical protein C0991_009325 [Blastosporella zonata]